MVIVHSSHNIAAEANGVDGNDDGVVNYQDLRNYRTMARRTTGSSWYDVNTDGYTNSTDQQIIVQNLGVSCTN